MESEAPVAQETIELDVRPGDAQSDQPDGSQPDGSQPDEKKALVAEFQVAVPVGDDKFGEPYIVTLETKPARFYFEANFIVTVFPGSPAEKCGIRPSSRVVKVNDIDIGEGDDFKKVYDATEVPMQFTLQQEKSWQQGSATTLGGGGEQKAVLSKADLVGLLLVYASIFLDFFGLMMAIPIMPLFARTLNVSNSGLGFITAAYQGAAIPGGMITLFFAQKFGTKYGILYSMFGTAGTLILVSFAWDFPSLIIFRAVAGLTGNSVPVAITHIGIVVPSHLKPRYFSYVGLTIMVALVVAPAMGGALAKFGLQVPWLVGGGIAVLGAIFAVFKLPNNLIPKASSTETSAITPVMRACLVLQFFKTLPMTCMTSMVGMYLVVEHNLDSNAVGFVLTIHGLSSVFNTALVYPQLRRFLSVYQLWVLGISFMTIGYGCAGFMQNYVPFLVFISLFGGWGNGYLLNSITPITDRWATPTTRAKLHSYGGILDNVGATAGSMVWGVVYDFGTDNGEPSLLWWAAAGMCFIVGCIGLVLIKCVFQPLEVQAKIDKDAASSSQAKEREHKFTNFKQANPTEDDYLALGKAVGESWTKKNYQWTTRIGEFKSVMDRFLPPLPTDTMENYFRGIQEVIYKSRECDQFYHDKEDIFAEAFENGVGYKTMY